MSVSPYGLFELPVWGYVLVTFLTIQTHVPGGDALPASRPVPRRPDPAPGAAARVPLLAVVQLRGRHQASGSRCTAGTMRTPISPATRTVRWSSACRRVLLEGYELYATRRTMPETLRNYGRGTPDDWLERHVYCAHPYTGITLFVLPAPAPLRRAGILMIAVHLAAQPFFAAGVINGLGHAVGYRSFEMPSTRHQSACRGGCSWAGRSCTTTIMPSRARRASPCSPGKLDIGWLWICLFRGLGLARVRWVAPRPQLRAPRAASSTRAR